MARFTTAGGSGSGAPGPQGPEGDSAYDVAVANGFVGTEQEWLDSLGGGTDNHGDFYFDESTLRVESSIMTIEANEGDGTVASQIKLTAGDMPIDIASYRQDSALFGTSDWSTAEWQSDGNGAGQIVITGSTNVVDFLNTSFNGSFQKITVNNEFMSDYNGGSYGGDAATLYVSTGPEGGTPVTITTLTFSWSDKSGITIDYDDDEMNIVANNMQLNIDSTGNEDININASDDLRLESGDDMFLRSNGYINFVSSADNNNYEWRMESNGTLEFPARGRLRNPGSSSGDGNGYDTFEIIPDFSRYEYDQYLIVDPTQPNHIHVRAGGTQDGSLAELIIGGEDTYVKVSDTDDSVTILANNININSSVSPSSLNINTYSGATIQSNRTSAYSDEDKVVAVLGDINAVVAAETAFTVNGGSLGTQPTFTGDPLFSGTYVKTGPLVHFQIQVDMDNILTFGDGQYYVDLPFPAKYGYQFKEGCLHDISTGKQYAIGGHVYAGQSQLGLTFTNSAGQDELFDFNSPVTLSTADNFHISGTYITN